MLAGVERAIEEQTSTPEEAFSSEATDEDRLSNQDKRRIEDLFALAQQDRSKAFELKNELDRLAVFREYEDRFLDLFKKPGA